LDANEIEYLGTFVTRSAMDHASVPLLRFWSLPFYLAWMLRRNVVIGRKDLHAEFPKRA